MLQCLALGLGVWVYYVDVRVRLDLLDGDDTGHFAGILLVLLSTECLILHSGHHPGDDNAAIFVRDHVPYIWRILLPVLALLVPHDSMRQSPC